MHKKMEAEESAAADDDRPRNSRQRRRLAVCLVLVVGFFLALAAVARATAFTAALRSVLAWFQRHRTLGAWLFMPFEAAWIIVLLPTTPLELACGFIFGWQLGLMINLVGKLCGCLLAFAGARRCRGRVARAVLVGDSIRIIHALDQVRGTRASKARGSTGGEGRKRLLAQWAANGNISAGMAPPPCE